MGLGGLGGRVTLQQTSVNSRLIYSTRAVLRIHACFTFTAPERRSALGVAWPGVAWPGVAWRGAEWRLMPSSHVRLLCKSAGAARPGTTRHDQARPASNLLHVLPLGAN